MSKHPAPTPLTSAAQDWYQLHWMQIQITALGAVRQTAVSNAQPFPLSGKRYSSRRCQAPRNRAHDALSSIFSCTEPRISRCLCERTMPTPILEQTPVSAYNTCAHALADTCSGGGVRTSRTGVHGAHASGEGTKADAFFSQDKPSERLF